MKCEYLWTWADQFGNLSILVLVHVLKQFLYRWRFPDKLFKRQMTVKIPVFGVEKNPQPLVWNLLYLYLSIISKIPGCWNPWCIENPVPLFLAKFTISVFISTVEIPPNLELNLISSYYLKFEGISAFVRLSIKVNIQEVQICGWSLLW